MLDFTEAIDAKPETRKLPVEPLTLKLVGVEIETTPAMLNEISRSENNLMLCPWNDTLDDLVLSEPLVISIVLA
jgi:hypothetical protein